MKLLEKINQVLICIVLCLFIIAMITILSKQGRIKYDLNGDGQVNSGDMVCLRKYILGQVESEDKNG